MTPHSSVPLSPVLVRVAPEILAELEAEESPPVVFVSAEKQDDGTYELVFQRSARIAKLEAALRQIADTWIGGCPECNAQEIAQDALREMEAK